MSITTQPCITNNDFKLSKLENASKSMENYNVSSLMQLKWIYLGKKNLELAVPLLKLEDNFTVVDFACSHGKNSMSVINQLLSSISGTEAAQKIKSMIIYHNDLPDNDFDEVMKCVNDAEMGYKYHELITSNQVELATNCVGRSYYNQIVEDETVDFAFCYTSLHWMPEYKDLDFGLMYTPQNGKNELDQWFENLSENYLKQWLSLRYDELKPSGIVSFNIISYSNFNDIMNFEWLKFLKSKNISPKVLANVNIPVVCRPKTQIVSVIESFKDQFKIINFESISDSTNLSKSTFRAMLYNQILPGLNTHEDLFPKQHDKEEFYKEFETQCYSKEDFIKFDTVNEWILLQKI